MLALVPSRTLISATVNASVVACMVTHRGRDRDLVVGHTRFAVVPMGARWLWVRASIDDRLSL